jgi:hypothetical protein
MDIYILSMCLYVLKGFTIERITRVYIVNTKATFKDKQCVIRECVGTKQ